MLINDFTNIDCEDEKRKIRRYKLIYNPEVFDNETNELIGYIDDISSRGAMVIGYKPYTMKNIYNIKIILPQEIYHTQYLSIEATCIRCAQDINSDYYNIGFLFHNIGDKEQEVISKLIDEYSF